MDLNTKLIIKVQLNDEIRKMPIHNEDITYDELIIMMERVFKHKLSAEDEIIIKYKDEDGDLITISDDSDLAFAIESSNILKLCLTIENNAKEEAKVSPSNLSGEDMVAVRKELQMIRDHANRLLDRLVHGQGADGAVNTVTSGRTSVTGGKDFQEGGGKEFDPLSTGNHSQSFQPVERSETGNSLGSGGRIEDTGMKSNTEEHGETGDIHRPGSAGNMIKHQQQNPLYNNMVGHTQMQTSVHNTPSTMTYGMGNTDMSSTVTGKNIPLTQHMPPNMGQNIPNMGGQNMGVNMGGSNLPPPNLGGPSMPPNMIGSNMPPNMSGPNMTPNMGGTNMPPSMIGSNMPPSNLNANVGGPNLPPSMVGQNISKPMDIHMHSLANAPSAFSGNINASGYQNHPQSDPSKPSSYMNQSVPGQIPQQRQFYPNAMQPPRVSPNFQGPSNAMQAPSNMQPRPPGAGSYFNPQGNVSQFNPAMSQPNLNYGYTSSQK